MNARMTGLCALLLAAALPAAAEPTAEQPQSAQLVRQQGIVQVRAPSGALLAVEKLPVALSAGTQVVTGPQSGAGVMLPDGTNIDIGSETTVQVSEPEPRVGATLYLRDGTIHQVDPRSRLLLAWPSSGNGGAKDGPDFRIELPANGPQCAEPLASARPPLAPPWTEPKLPGYEDLRDAAASATQSPDAEPETPAAGPEPAAAAAPAQQQTGVIDIEINGDDPPKVERR